MNILAKASKPVAGTEIVNLGVIALSTLERFRITKTMKMEIMHPVYEITRFEPWL